MRFERFLASALKEEISPQIGGVEQTRALKDELKTAVKDVGDEKANLQSSKTQEQEKQRQEELKKDLERRRKPLEQERERKVAELKAAQTKISSANEVNISAADEITQAIEGLPKAQDEMARIG